MVKFPHSPLVRHITDEKCILEEDFLFEVKINSINYKILIKKGLTFDGASIPRIAWRVIGHPFSMPLLVSALPHDGIYVSELFPQKDCDWIFLCLMQKVGINWVKRNTIYSAVRLFGWSVWRKHTKSSIKHGKEFVEIYHGE